MVRLLWALLCQRVLTDQNTNSVSYIEAVEAFGLPKFPAQFPPLVLGTVWQTASSVEASTPERLEVVLRSPSKKSTVLFDVPQGDFGDEAFHRLNFNLGGAPLLEPGEYEILLRQFDGKRWRRAGGVFLQVDHVDQQSSSGA